MERRIAESEVPDSFKGLVECATYCRKFIAVQLLQLLVSAHVHGVVEEDALRVVIVPQDVAEKRVHACCQPLLRDATAQDRGPPRVFPPRETDHDILHERKAKDVLQRYQHVLQVDPDPGLLRVEQQQEAMDVPHLLPQVGNHRVDESGVSALRITEPTQIDPSHGTSSASPWQHERHGLDRVRLDHVAHRVLVGLEAGVKRGALPDAGGAHHADRRQRLRLPLVRAGPPPLGRHCAAACR
mmetsp:Transcript_129503/g.360775  ORF Transcript_129503/g.360775 Transcript_129503/m.360775 type:complete len:241 (+) Transcript_129503:746-1468(+)